MRPCQSFFVESGKKRRNETLVDSDVDGDDTDAGDVGKPLRRRSRGLSHDDAVGSDEDGAGKSHRGRGGSRKKESQRQEVVPPGFCSNSVVNMTCDAEFPGHLVDA